MSDIWERPQQLLNPPKHSYNWDEIGESFEKRKEERKKNIEQWGFVLPDDQYLALNTAVANGQVTVDEGYKLLSSIALSQQYNIPASHIRENYDDFINSLQGQSEGPRMAQTTYSFLVNKWRSGRSIFKLSELNKEYRLAEYRGDAERVEFVKNEIQKLRQDLYRNSDPNEKERNEFIQALGAAAESTPFTLYVAASAFAGSLVAPGVGTAAAFTASMGVLRDIEYGALREAGASHQIADNVSLVSGAVQAAIESFLGNALSLAGGAAKTAGKKMLTENVTRSLIEKATANAVKTAQGNGLFLKTALHVGGTYFGEMFEEGLEELMQEWISAMSLEVANILQEGGVETLSREERHRQMEEAFQGGFMASIFLGIPGTGLNVRASMKSWQRVQTEARRSGSETEFTDRTKEEEIWKHLPDEERLEHQRAAYAAAEPLREQDEARVTADIRNTAGLGAGYAEKRDNSETGEAGYYAPGTNTQILLGETYYNKDGYLHTELDTERGIFKAGDPRVKGNHNLYSHIDFKTDDNGKVHIKNFHVRNDLDNEEFRYKVFERFAERFAGTDIVWDGKGMSEAEVNIKSDLIKRNHKGTGLNYYPDAISDDISDIAVKGDTAQAAQMKFRFGEQMAKHLPGSTETSRDGLVRLIDRIGRSYGLTFDKFIEKLGLDSDNIFTHKPGKAVIAGELKAAQFAKDNPQVIRGALQPWKKLDADVKGVEYKIVYLKPGSADYSTVLHELKHAVDNFLEKYDPDLFKRMMDAAGEYDPNNSKGLDKDTWQRERSAFAFEEYMRTGQAPTQELRGLFQQMKEWLRDIVNRLNELRKITPEQKKVFDELLSKADKVAEEWEASEAAKDAAYPQKGDRERYEANKKFNEERTSLSKNNLPTDSKPEQTDVTSIEELREKAKKHISELDLWAKSIVAAIKEKHGIELEILWRPTDKDNPDQIKSVKSIQDKLDKGDKITEILDVMGITLVADNLQDMVKIAEELRSRADSEVPVVRIKDRYKELEASGYRDFLTNIKLSDGMIAEVQINVKQMLSAKPLGHKIFEIPRSFKEAVEKNQLTNEQADKDELILKAISKEYYDKAYQAVLEESHFNASSRDISLPSHVLDRSNLDLTSVLSSFTLNKLHDLGIANSSSQYTSPSMSTNLKSGSSNDGTSTAGAGEVNLSTEVEDGSELNNSVIEIPSTNSIDAKTNSVNSNLEKNTPENKKRSENAKEKWKAAQRVTGFEDQITKPNGEVIKGHYVLGEAGISTPSHDPNDNFSQSENFPVNENGSTMNVGRAGYSAGHARQVTEKIASTFDQRGLGIIVDENGITASGNGRDQARRIAAKNETDKKYIDYLKSNPGRWGFTQEDIAKFEHPTLYFVVPAPSEYTPLYFDQFNRSGKKANSPLETAVKMSHLVDADMIKEFSAALGVYENISDLYEDIEAVNGIFKSLMKRGIVNENAYPEFVETFNIDGKEYDRVTPYGREFIESVMLGGVLSESIIYRLALSQDIKEKVIKALVALVDNAALGQYCVISEANQAISIAVEIKKDSKNKSKNIDDYANQQEMDMGQRISKDTEIVLAKQLLEKTKYAFAETMSGLNTILQEQARGQGDIFGRTSKDDILYDFLGIKKEKDAKVEENNKVIESDEATGPEKVEAAIDNAGLAKGETDGTLFQIIGEKGAAALDKAEESTHRLDNLEIARQMEAAGKHVPTIRMATGWERGADGLWRYEILDVKIKDGYFYIGVNHPAITAYIGSEAEILKAYSELKEIKVIVGNIIGGEYNPETKTIRIEATDTKRRESMLIHEIQHAVQHIEGFAVGGNPSMFKNQSNRHSVRQNAWLSVKEKWSLLLKESQEEIRKLGKKAEQRKTLEKYQADQTADTALVDYLLAYVEYKELDTKPDSYFEGLTAYEQYHRLAGEVEARNAQTRMGFSASERTEWPLAVTEDVAREDQIFLNEGMQIAQMAERDGTLFQLGFHGSPHRFERFDKAHNREGEGSQAFGYGHYIAGNKEVGEYYRKLTASKYGLFDKMDDKKFSGRTMSEWNNYLNKLVYGKNPTEAQPIFNKLEMLENLMIRYDYKGTLNNARENKLEQESIEWFEQTFKDFQTPGQLYEVDIPGDEEMLDWDKKFDEQPEYVKKILKIMFEEDRISENYTVIPTYLTGANIYQEITMRWRRSGGEHAEQLASMMLNDYGIKGIRYLDQLSRSAGEGSHNYVIFDDNEINITQTFYQLDDELIEDASQYESWQMFRDSIETGKTTEADNAWYRSLWNDAKKIYPDDDTLFQDEEKISRADDLDNRFYKEADKKYLTEALRKTSVFFTKKHWNRRKKKAKRREKIITVQSGCRTVLKRSFLSQVPLSAWPRRCIADMNYLHVNTRT